MPTQSPMLLGSLRAPLWCMGWLSAVLVVDSVGDLSTQRALGVLTWLVLLLVLRSASALLRAQTLVVVLFATLVEYVFSDWLGVYVYRFDNVPAYVPPGHGLVYLSAFALGHAPVVRAHLRVVGAVVLTGLGSWALVGWLISERTDALGAFWFACLLGFWFKGPSREVYVGAAIVVTWLELAGTSLGTWTWQETGPAGVPMGNPPSGAAGGYGWFDLAGLLAAPHLVRWWRRLAPGSGSEPEGGDSESPGTGLGGTGLGPGSVRLGAAGPRAEPRDAAEC